MTEYLKNMLEEFPIKFKETSESLAPAGVDPFGEDLSKKLSKEMKTIFHQTVAQGCFM